MPKFILERDVNFFKSIAREVVNEVIQNTVVLFKINLNETRVNLYGESLNKTWHPGVELYALINKDTQQATYEGFGADMGQSVEFRFDRSFCEETNIYPEIGDVIFFDSRYYEIDTKTENQFVGGQSYNNFSIVCSTFAVREATLNISKRIN